MSLFPVDNTENILNATDGCVVYHGPIFSKQDADFYFQHLHNTIPWQHDEAIIFGKKIITKRMVAWYGSKAFDYTYSNITKQALPFTQELLQLKLAAEKITQATYNSCLINLYHNNTEGMAYHSDNEKMLAPHASIASISLGAERKFLFRHKVQKQTIGIQLQHGSLLDMQGATQLNWLHRLPTTTKICGARINLTFRTILEV